ncbi:tetratricopeptide repeat (TPR)-like superfamily protein [Wolffia australiana]
MPPIAVAAPRPALLPIQIGGHSPIRTPFRWRQADVVFTVGGAAAAAGASGPRRRREEEPTSSGRRHGYLDRSVDMGGLLGALSQASNPEELAAVMSPYLDQTRRQRRRLSLRFMVGLLAREADWRRSLALLDWMLEVAGYPASVFAFNVVLRNALRAAEWAVAAGLFDEMRDRHGLSPDRCSYATMISSLGKAGKLDTALSWLHRMERSGVRADLILYSTLIELARRLGDYSRAAALFARLRGAGIEPDAVACNSMLGVYAKAGLLQEARALLAEMGEAADDASFSILLSAYAEKGRFVEALSLFAEMRSGRGLDLTACNIMIDVYGRAGMAREADRLFWSMRRMGVQPSVVSYNTMLRVYGDAELVGEAVHLFRLMQNKGVEQNAVTYNTMIAIYGRSLEHEKAGNLLREMQSRGIAPNAVTYSTIISIWARAGKLARAAALFQKLQSSGAAAAEMDPVLYQTMIAAYEQAGLVAHARRLLGELNEGRSGGGGGVSEETAVVILAGAGRVEEAARMFRRIPRVKDVAVFRCMMELFAGSRRHRGVVEVLDRMRAAGFLPDAAMVGTAMHALGKLQRVDQAEALYREMQEEGCPLPDRVHFQMLGLHGARGDFDKVEALLAKLEADPNIDQRELRLVASGVYEKGNRLDEASRIIGAD